MDGSASSSLTIQSTADRTSAALLKFEEGLRNLKVCAILARLYLEGGLREHELPFLQDGQLDTAVQLLGEALELRIDLHGGG